MKRFYIEEIDSDEYMVSIIDELCYRIKVGGRQSEGITGRFMDTLRNFITDNELDSDPHNFATIKK